LRHYTSYSRGVNGIIVDIDKLRGTTTEADFAFRVSDPDNLGNWIPAPAPTSISVRSGNTLSAPVAVLPVAPQADMNIAEDPDDGTAEPIPAASTPLLPFAGNSLDEDYTDAPPITPAARRLAAELFVESPLPDSYIPKPQPISTGSSAIMLYRASTAEYDLRTLGDDLLTGNAADTHPDSLWIPAGYDDSLADILTESIVTVPL